MPASASKKVAGIKERKRERACAANAALIASDAELLSIAGRIRGERILIFGSSALELLCAVLHKGAAEATLLRAEVKPDEHVANLAIVNGIRSSEGALAAVTRAGRALAASGRIVLRIEADPMHRMTDTVARLLRMHGFHAIRIRPFADGAILAGSASALPELRHA